MDHFLVDYENIGEAGLKGIENLGSDTSTVIFYSEHADKISFDMHQVLCKCLSKLEFRKAETGKKNALDFQLSTYLGYLVASHPGDRFFIISKDNGYRVVMDFWNKNTIQQLDYIGRAYEKGARQNPLTPASTEPRTERSQPAAVTPMPAPSAQSEKAAIPVQGEKTEAHIQNGKAETPVQGEKTEAHAHTVKDEAPAEKAKAPEADKVLTSEPKEEEKKSGHNAVPANDNPAEGRTRRGGRRRNSGPKEPPVDEFKPSQELMSALSQLIDGEEERENIGRFIVKYKTKQGVNNAIVKIYGTEKAGELYKKIKPLLKDKKGK